MISLAAPRDVDLAGVAKADHMFDEVTPVVPAHADLIHLEGLEALTAQILQHGRGRDVTVAFGTAFDRRLGENVLARCANLLIGQGGTQSAAPGAVRDAGS